MFEELEVVKLAHDIKEHKLKKGDIGTIVLVYEKGKAYEVEFVNEGGRTLALLTLTSDEISPVKNEDIPHMRSLVPHKKREGSCGELVEPRVELLRSKESHLV